MAELGSMNATTTVTTTTEKTSDGLSISQITRIVGLVIAALALCTPFLLFYLKRRGESRGNRQQPLPTEEEIALNSSNVDTGTRQNSADTSGVLLLKRCQQQLFEHYKDTTSTIPAHPLDPSRTVDIDQFFSELELERELEGHKTTQEPIQLPEGTRNVDRVRTTPLDSWGDMFKDVVGKLRILLSGSAGFGKSTLLLRVANASIHPNSVMAKFKLVFLVKLREMRSTSCVLEAIRNQILPNFAKADLKQLINDNEVETTFLFDGLDEIPSNVLNSAAPENGYGVKDILHNKVLRRSTVLVSTRPHMIDFAIQGYPHYARVRTLGFTFETAKKYITSYFATKGAAGEGNSLISLVTSSSLLSALAHIPILVLFMCVVWENLSKLPEKLTELYALFAEALVRRRCSDDEDPVALLNSVLRGLGRVALKGLLDQSGERLVFSVKEFDDTALKNGRRLGFLQQEKVTSGLHEEKIVDFLHKSFQEYAAAYFFAGLHDTNEEEFHVSLQKINPGNVRAMKSLLRFACGITAGSPATALILKHVQSQRDEERGCVAVTMQRLARLLLFESGSDEMADNLDRPTIVNSHGLGDLLNMRYYLQCLHQPLLELTNFRVHCETHDELVLLREINDLLHDNNSMHPNFHITCRSPADLALLRDIVLCENIRPAPTFSLSIPFSVTYIMSEQANEEVLTLDEVVAEMTEKLLCEIKLHLVIDEKSHFDDDCVLYSHHRVCSQIKGVALRNRTYEDVSRLANVLRDNGRLTSVIVHDTNLHGHLHVAAPLVSNSLRTLELHACGLNDDDVPDLISILPARHDLWVLSVPRNDFSLSGVQSLTYHLRMLPNLTDHVFY